MKLKKDQLEELAKEYDFDLNELINIMMNYIKFLVLQMAMKNNF